jgi:phosphatidylserine decarboxylase
MDAIASVLTPLHREGYRFVAIFAVGTLVLFWFAEWLGWVGVGLTLWCAYFFRDPVRFTPVRAGLVISPADGVVQSVERAAPPPELGMGDAPMTRVAVFMNVFDVHVNRSPVDGQVLRSHYRPGKFINAALDKASEDNERQSLRIRAAGGQEIAVVQIAGLVARRILCEVREGDELEAGQRFGLIRFGSRVDVYLDSATSVSVVAGQRAVAGETVLADFASTEGQRAARAG